jgi:hypothetical protein
MSEGHSGNRKLIVELVIVLVLVGFGLWSLNKNPLTPSDSSVDANQTVTEDTSNGSVNANNPSSSISYQNALVQYKDARLQLDSTCQASPDRSTFKNGTNIMIDNRSDKPRTVKVGSTFPIKAYGFKIVRLSSSTLPATWYVDCDTSQNVATILIQK